MNWLHGANIIHCDLKPSNLMWDEKTKSVKVGDFGLSFITKKRGRGPEGGEEKGGKNSDSTPQGTIHYLSPEVYLKNLNTKARDVYSFGISIYTFICREKPFANHLNLRRFFLAVMKEEGGERPVLPQNDPFTCPPSLNLLAESCWQFDYKKRPSFQQILSLFDRQLLPHSSIYHSSAQLFWISHFYSPSHVLLKIRFIHFFLIKTKIRDSKKK